MGAAASTVNAFAFDELTRRFTKEYFLPELLALFDFNKICDGNLTVSLDDVIKALALKTDVFMTHNW